MPPPPACDNCGSLRRCLESVSLWSVLALVTSQRLALSLALAVFSVILVHRRCELLSGQLQAAAAKCRQMQPAVVEVRRVPTECTPVVYEGAGHRAGSNGCAGKYLPMLRDFAISEGLHDCGAERLREATETVPRLLHLWPESEPSVKAASVDALLRLNPGWRCVLWTWPELVALGREFSGTTEARGTEIDASILLTFLPLYKFGGLRISQARAFKATRSLEPLLLSDGFWAGSIADSAPLPGQRIRVSARALFATPGHPMLLALVSSGALLAANRTAAATEDELLERALGLYENLQPQLRDAASTVRMLPGGDYFPVLAAAPTPGEPPDVGSAASSSATRAQRLQSSFIRFWDFADEADAVATDSKASLEGLCTSAEGLVRQARRRLRLYTVH